MKKPVLPAETKAHAFTLEPVYDHYKIVKVVDRCECCDHKIGEHREKRGVKIIDWKIRKHKKDYNYVLNQYYSKRLLERASLELGL